MEGITAWEIILFFLALLGCIGSIVPALPGLPLTLAALTVYAAISQFQGITLRLLLMAVVFSGVALASSCFLGSILVRRYGKVRIPSVAILGGSLVGLFIFGPAGIVIGPVLVAFAGALFSGAELGRGVCSALAMAVSMILSVIIEFLVSAWMVYVLFSCIFL